MTHNELQKMRNIQNNIPVSASEEFIPITRTTTLKPTALKPTTTIRRSRSRTPLPILIVIHSLSVLLLLLSGSVSVCDATITIMQTGDRYQSLVESNFGKGNILQYGEVEARLQYFDHAHKQEATDVDSNIYLCNSVPFQYITPIRDDPDPNPNPYQNPRDEVIVPQDHHSIAILARQGVCTIEHKARIASQLNDGNERNGNTEIDNPVQFLIVYQYDSEEEEEYYWNGYDGNENGNDGDGGVRGSSTSTSTSAASGTAQAEKASRAESYDSRIERTRNRDIIKQDQLYLERLLQAPTTNKDVDLDQSQRIVYEHMEREIAELDTRLGLSQDASANQHLAINIEQSNLKEFRTRNKNENVKAPFLHHAPRHSDSISKSFKILYDNKINVAILYISKQSGASLTSYLQTHAPYNSSLYHEGGVQIFLDGYQGWDGYGTDTGVTVWDIISITVLSFICCLSIVGLCTNNGVVSLNGNANGVVVVEQGGGGRRRGADGRPQLPGRYRHGLRLLEEEEVMRLPEHGFCLETVLGGDVGIGGGDEEMQISDGQVDGNGVHASSLASSSLTTPLLPDHAASASTHNHHHYRFQDISCTICLEDYSEGEKLRILPCGHAFHQDCILPWLTDRSPTCPLCKAHLVVVRDGDEEALDDNGDDSDSDDDGDSEAGVDGNNEDIDLDSDPFRSGFASWFWSVLNRDTNRQPDDVEGEDEGEGATADNNASDLEDTIPSVAEVEAGATVSSALDGLAASSTIAEVSSDDLLSSSDEELSLSDSSSSSSSSIL